MVYRICKSIELESGHLLSKHPGNCKFPHGHTRSVEMVFRAETLDANDMVLDFKAVKQMMGDFLQQFDHSLCVNTEDPNYAAFVAAYGEGVFPGTRWKKPGRTPANIPCGPVLSWNACACGKPAAPGRNMGNN